MNRLPNFWHQWWLHPVAWLICSAVFAASPLPETTVYTPGQGVALEVSKSSPAYTSITLRSPDVIVTTHTVGYENFQAFSLEGEPSQPAEGRPRVPMVYRFYRIPNTGSVSLMIRESDYDVVDNVTALPYQEEYAARELLRDASVYERNEWFPANIAEMSAPMIMRDFRIVGVGLYPVQVNPVTHQARIYRNLSVDLVANDLPGENELTHPRRPSGNWAPMYRSYISNLDESALDDVTTSPGAIMIFAKTDTASRRWSDSLAEWKTRRGYKTMIYSQPTWQPSDITNLIHNAYQTWQDPPLEYVVMMGNSFFGVPMDPSGSDHTYALGNTQDDIEDVGVGRLCGNSNSEMAVILAKVINYERNPRMESAPGVADTAWFHRAFLAGSTSMSCASNYTLMQWAASEFRQFTAVRNAESMAMNGMDNTACQERFNLGIAFFAWRGSYMEGNPNMVDGCAASWRLPIGITITCGSSGVAERLMTGGSSSTPNSPKGGVCGIGTMGAGTHNPQNITMMGGFLYNVANLNVEHLGDAVAGAKAQLYLNNAMLPDQFSSWNILYGDPSLSMWTDVPKVLTVAHPTFLNVGARSVEVTVRRQGDDQPIADATVCLWKKAPDSTWVVGTTDVNGHLVLPVSVNSAGNMALTVTKRNCKPYLANIPCGTTDCMPMICDHILDDDNAGGTHGNNDGILNAGETVDVFAQMKNYGTENVATNGVATLTSTDPRVTVLNGTTAFANIAPGDSVVCDPPFRIQASPVLPHRKTVQLMVSISSSAGIGSGLIELECISGDLTFLSSQFVGGAFAPGTTRSLYVVVKDTGQVGLTGVTGRLESLSPFVTVPTEEVPFGDIAAGARDSNSTNPFVVTAHPLTYKGHQAPMLLVLSTPDGFVDTTQFTINVGPLTTTDPTGPDAYGYYAYDNTDVNYPLYPTFNYVDISQGLGQNLNLNDVGEKTSPTPVWSTTRVLPFPFKFYGRTYDTLTICSNGWVAFGNQGWNDLFRNYRIPGMQAPDAMIAPYWDDLKTYVSPGGGGLGVWAYYDVDSGRFIVQWKATTTASTAPQNFEVMLYDSAARPSMDGNGYVVVQYSQVAMNQGNDQDNEPTGCTIGIQAPGARAGLEYAYISTYSPGSATVVPNRAILFTTDATRLMGELDGHVYDAETNQPLSGVVISTSRYDRRATTDAQGHYHLDHVLIGRYQLFTDKYRYTDDTLTVMIGEDSISVADFHLRHPEIRLSTAAISDSANDEPVQTTFDVINDGNGPVDYTSQVFFAGDVNPAPWDSVGAIRVTQVTTDPQVWGCEFFHGQWWVTGGNGPGGQNVLYRFNLHGDYLGSVPQPSTSVLGWFDLATDGQYLYGSDGPGILAIDDEGLVHDTIPSPLSPTRAIAYDPLQDHFWVADYASDIYELDRMGNVYEQIPNRGDTALAITGLAWNAADPIGCKLYVFSRNGDTSQVRVTKINPVSRHQEMLTDLRGLHGDNAAGCTITSNWNSILTVFAAVVRNPSGCRLGIYEMAFNQSWITVMPSSATVPGGSSQTVTVSFNPAMLNSDSYRVNAVFWSAGCDTTLVLPITLTVHHLVNAEPRATSVPSQYALYQNYPNPFNPATEIRFDLPRTEHVRLKVYNTLGQQVADLTDEVRTAGVYTVHWDASSLASGLYLCRIEAGPFTQVRKMLLLK